MDNQEAFNGVVEHLLKQRVPAFDVIDGKNAGMATCRYRTKHGLKCGIGGIMPDEIYDPAMEGLSVAQVINGFKKAESFFAGARVDLLCRLQVLHDRNASNTFTVESINDDCVEIANDFELKLPNVLLG